LLYAQVEEAAAAAKRGEGEILYAPLTKIAASLQHYSSHTQFASDILHQVSLTVKMRTITGFNICDKALFN
jgi:hypothetical protein